MCNPIFFSLFTDPLSCSCEQQKDAWPQTTTRWPKGRNYMGCLDEKMVRNAMAQSTEFTTESLTPNKSCVMPLKS